MSHGLFLNNFNSATYVNLGRNYHSNLDLVLSTQSLRNIVSVEVDDETWGSDHCPIYINVAINKFFYSSRSF